MDTSDAQTLRLEYSRNPTIESMLNLIPDYSTGKNLHDLIIDKQMGVLPGDYAPPPEWRRSSFRGTFYARWQRLPLAEFVESDTGLKQDWWVELSVALLCQSIAYLNKTVRKHLNEDRINRFVDDARTTLHRSLYLFYARLLAEFPPFKVLLNDLQRQGLGADGKHMFREAMLQNGVVWTLWYKEGWWTNRDWDLFNNYAKYIALGADAAEVDEVIEELRGHGVPIPDTVDKNHWRSYTQYLYGQPSFDHTSIDDVVRDPVTAKYTYWSAAHDPHFGGGKVTERNYYSERFVDKHAPGGRFRK